MKIIIATEDKPYFLWQMLVQTANFKKFGYDVNTTYVVATSGISQQLQKMIDNKDFKPNIITYDDTRMNPVYISSIRPHILSKFFKEHKDFEKEAIFYTDPDVLFVNAINFENYEKDTAWHCSDSSTYLSASYIVQKGGEMLFAKMCDILGMNSDLIKSIPAGGAHYILKGINSDFWDKCYTDMENMSKMLQPLIHIDSTPITINRWCVDMWVVLWNSAFIRREVILEKDMSFSWATDDIALWEKNNIYHNAGDVSAVGFFNKHQYMDETPFNKDIEVKNDNCSYNYYLATKETEKVFNKLIF